MDITKLSSDDLRDIIRLLEQKETLQAELEKVDKALVNYVGGNSATKRVAKTKRSGGVSSGGAKRGRKSKVKDEVMALLKEAFPQSMAVRDLADRIGVKLSSMNAWFSTSGKKIDQIEKAGVGRYVWKKPDSEKV